MNRETPSAVLSVSGAASAHSHNGGSRILTGMGPPGPKIMGPGAYNFNIFGAGALI